MSAAPLSGTYRARYVFPADAPPIRDGVVAFDGGRITFVGREAGGGAVEDLGNAAILPGLVNAHTHLEFSDLDVPLGRAGNRLPEWIGAVVARRRQAAEASPQADPLRNVRRGLEESRAAGVTALGEIATAEWLAEAPGLDVTVFRELLGLSTARVEPQIQLATEYLQAAQGPCGFRPGLSPHAPYSVHPDLLAAAIRLACQAEVPLAMHLAESVEELELLASGGGPFVQLLQDLDAWDPTAIPRGIRPLDYLEQLSAAPRVLVIHGNYLIDDEMQFLGRHSDQMSVVYCPRTHAWFGHGRYPLGQLLAAGANVALGTDSRASSPDLDLLAEMRTVARQHPEIAPEQVLRLGTLCGARALGLHQIAGSLTTGKRADLAIVALPDSDAEPYELLFGADTPVVRTLCPGA